MVDEHMRCCEKCFGDAEIISRIKTIKQKGNCDFCGSKNVYTLDIDAAKNSDTYAPGFIADFVDLAELFKSSMRPGKSRKLSDFLKSSTSIFSNKIHWDHVDSLIRELISDSPEISSDFLNQLVEPLYLSDQKQLSEFGIFHGKSWTDFEKDIKTNNRFHSKIVNDEILQLFFRHNIKIIRSSNQRFYRARISDTGKALLPKEMKITPLGKSTSGRLNASGIGYLYLSEDESVCLSEIKASVEDVVSIASFKVKRGKSLFLVDLSAIAKTSLFSFSDDKTTPLMNWENLQKIDESMTKLSSKDRSEIEYAPTEYISDLIKSTTIPSEIESQGKEDMLVDGIIYKSTLNNNVRDLVLFHDDKMSLIKPIKTERIKGINFYV